MKVSQNNYPLLYEEERERVYGIKGEWKVMANYRNCIHQGFAYAANGYKDVHIVCDLTGDIYKKKYCKICEYYQPRKIYKGVEK